MHIFLLHRDLRLTDSTALIHQIKEMGSTTIIFILTPEQVNIKKLIKNVLYSKPYGVASISRWRSMYAACVSAAWVPTLLLHRK